MTSSINIISASFDYLFIFIFCLIGAVVKDTYNTLSNKDCTVKITRIVISTLVSSIILFSISDKLLNIMSWKLFILPCFVGGMIGFESMSKITKLSFWIKILNKNKDKIIEEIEKDEKNSK